MRVDVAIVIPARNEAPLIAACLEALNRQTIGASALEVIVVAAGEDDTAGAAARAAARLPFGRFEVLHLASGNKNTALQLGCPRATAPIVVLLDADTVVAPSAIEELSRAIGEGPVRAVHGAALPRYDTRVSRYWELNRRLVKEVRFDGELSGELVAIRRATLAGSDLTALFPDSIGPKDDLYLGRVLAAQGCAIGYVRSARATTLVPWTLSGLATTMLRSRRSAMAVLPLGAASLQAAISAAIVGGVPAALVASRWSASLALIALAPLFVHTSMLVLRVGPLCQPGYRRDLPYFLGLDLFGRALKVIAFTERLIGRAPPRTFRGQRPYERARAMARHSGAATRPTSRYSPSATDPTT